MKRIISIGLLAALMQQVAMANITIGKVDIQKVMVSIQEGKKVRSRLEKLFNKKKKELKSSEETIRTDQQKLQKRASILDSNARLKEERKIQKKIVTLQQKTVEYQKEIHKLEKELKKPILDKLKPIVAEVSKKNNVAVTFEVSAAPIVYAQKEVDITESVIKSYDTRHPVKK
jgi:outer membrane protein